MRSRSALAILLLVAPLAGCLSFEGGSPVESYSWHGVSEGGTVSTRNGTAASNIVYLERGGRKEVLLLVEGTENVGVSGGGSPGGTIFAPDGHPLLWSCQVHHGKLREMRLDGTAYPLEAGRVFHIDVRDGRVVVHQIRFDPNAFADEKGALRKSLRAASAGPIVAGFCERTNPAP
jgi:hypothetical protein